MQRSPIVSMLIGTGVSGGTAAALRAWTDLDKWATLIGTAAGAAVGGLLLSMKKTRALGIDTIASAVIFNGPRVIEDMATKPSAAAQKGLIAAAVGHLQAGNGPAAAASLARAFGVVTAERVSRGVAAGLLGSAGTGATVDLRTAGVTRAERVRGPSGQAVDIMVGHTTAFGAIPLAGAN